MNLPNLQGPAKVKVNAPKEYLVSHSKEPKLPESEYLIQVKKNYKLCPFFTEKPFSYPDSDCRRPAVPTHIDQPQMGSKTSKNFITTNAVNNIMSVPRKPAPKYVDTAGGTRHDLEVSLHGQRKIALLYHPSSLFLPLIEFWTHTQVHEQKGELQSKCTNDVEQSSS